jgi:hypothetical protein
MHLALCVFGLPPVPLHELIGVFSAVHTWPPLDAFSEKYRNAIRYDWREREDKHRGDEQRERDPEIPPAWDQPGPGRQRPDRPAPAQLRQRPGTEPAIHAIALVRMRSCPHTRAYVGRRTAEGKTPRGIRRCLKRYVARELYRQLPRTLNLPEAA